MTNSCKKNVNSSGFILARKLKRLELVMTNTCNLACVYCYADSGTYGLESNENITEVK